MLCLTFEERCRQTTVIEGIARVSTLAFLPLLTGELHPVLPACIRDCVRARMCVRDNRSAGNNVTRPRTRWHPVTLIAPIYISAFAYYWILQSAAYCNHPHADVMLFMVMHLNQHQHRPN